MGDDGVRHPYLGREIVESDPGSTSSSMYFLQAVDAFEIGAIPDIPIIEIRA